MKISDFISITKNFVFGKGYNYIAAIGEISATGQKPVNAILLLRSEIEKLAKNHNKIKVIPIQNKNTVVIVRWCFGGWQYSFFDLDSGKEHGICLLNSEWNFDAACVSAQNHAKDYV